MNVKNVQPLYENGITFWTRVSYHKNEVPARVVDELAPEAVAYTEEGGNCPFPVWDV